MNSWQPIETAPDATVDLLILVYGGRYATPTVVAADGEYWRFNIGKLKAIPTHWMPLPNPPTV